MKRILSFFTLILLVVSCTVSSEPEFIKIENIVPKKVSLLGVNIVSDAIFYNPNDIGCELVATDITVLINSNEVGKAKQTKNIEVLSKGEFIIPLEVSFLPMKLIEDSEAILTSSLPNLLNQKVTVTYSGKVSLKKAGVTFDIPIDKTDEILLKK